MGQAAAGSAAGESSEGGMWSPSYNLVLMDVDWFRITIDPYQKLPPGQPNPGGVIYVSTKSGVDVGVELYDSNGKLVKAGRIDRVHRPTGRLLPEVHAARRVHAVQFRRQQQHIGRLALTLVRSYTGGKSGTLTVHSGQ